MTNYFIIPEIIFSFHVGLILSPLPMSHVRGEMHADDEGITIGFNRAIFDMLPNVDEYSAQAAQQRIPFDISMIVKKWNKQ